MKVSSRTWIPRVRLSLVLGMSLLVFLLFSEHGERFLTWPEEAHKKRGNIFFYVFFPSTLAYLLKILFSLIETLRLSSEMIEVIKYPFLKKLSNEIDCTIVKKISINSGNSTAIFFDFDGGKPLKLEALGLTDFEGDWLEPPFSEYMPSDTKSRAAFKIAYNISKKYNIPFETEHIKE